MAVLYKEIRNNINVLCIIFDVNAFQREPVLNKTSTDIEMAE